MKHKNVVHLLCIASLFLLLLSCTKNPSDTKIPSKDSVIPSPIVGTVSDLTSNVPLGGNAYLTSGKGATIYDQSSYGLHNWTDTSAIVSTYFRIKKTGILYVGVKGYSPIGNSVIKLTVKDSTFRITLNGTTSSKFYGGGVKITDTGYLKVDIQGISKTGTYIGDLTDLLIGGPAGDSVVAAMDSTNYYWSRRGPSVHLSYSSYKDSSYEWMYNEVTVPSGQDPIGSYYMSNGFNEGYFGMQVKSSTVRWMIFSVWDPSIGKTTLVSKGSGVVDANFSGEGTGGQTYLVYPWVANTTYKFLTRIRPDGAGNTLYSSWFYAPELGKWSYMATFKRPNTNTYVKGPYSFLENFTNTTGYIGRKVYFNNLWQRTVYGKWLESSTAAFTIDATGTNKQRFDYKGGVENGKFFLQNDGFFNDYVKPQTFTKTANGVAPSIDLSALPTN